MSDLPVACSLLPAELQERRLSVLAKVRAVVCGVTELDNGFIYRFPSDRELIPEIANLIQLEHQCCPFLTFRLTVEPGNGAVLLELTGPAGTKEFLQGVFN